MEMQHLIEELAGSEHETYEKATDADIAKTERLLGMSLPASYKTFVRSFSNGAYLYHLQEVSAVGKGNQQIAPIDAIYPVASGSSPIPYRDLEGEVHPSKLIPFGLDSNANAWCFVVEDGRDEYPVAYLHTWGSKLYARLDGFGTWLAKLIEEQDEIIRVLYDADVIDGELKLG